MKTKSDSNMLIQLTFIVFLEINLLRNGQVTASTSEATSYSSDVGLDSNNEGSKDLLSNIAGSQHNKEELADRVLELELQFKRHVSTSKTENEEQYEKIVILNAAKKAQEEKFKLIFNEMKVLKDQNRDQMARIVQLEEVLKTRMGDTSSIQSNAEPISINNGRTIPSSCEDLKSNGHRLNGIYMVFDASVKKFLAIHCNFLPSSTSEKVIGSLSINTLVGGVYFYAQMKTTFRELNKIIPFDQIMINQGNGLSLSNKGIFKAPRAGIYHFTFKGNYWGNSKIFQKKEPLIAELRHNGITIGDTTTYDGTLHVHATLKLQAGDLIYIFKSSNGDLYTDETPDVHFSGWLLEEDVSI